MTEKHPDEESESARNERHRHAERRHWRFEKIGGSFAILFTAIAASGAVVSAIAAWHAYDAANRAVAAAIAANEIAIRPYVKIDLLPDSFKVGPRVGGTEMSMQFSIANTGKLPAPVNIGGEILWSGAHHERGPWSFATLGQLFLFPNQDSGILTVKSPVLSDGQMTDLKSNTNRSAYVTIQVLYGPDPRRLADRLVRVCMIYAIKWDGSQFSLDVGETCPDDSSGRSNYAN